MVIIKCNVMLSDKDRRKLEINIHDQAADGVIVLPYFCDLLTDAPDGEGVQIVQPTQDDRVAELEQELARAMFYISAQKDCSTCKHEIGGDNAAACRAANGACAFCGSITCKCKYCHQGSNWEWRGLHG